MQNADDVEETVEFTIDGAYQFGGSPVKEQKAKSRAAGELAALNASGYEDGLETFLYEEMKKRNETIDISSYNVTDKTALGRVVSGVLNDHPDLYYVRNSWRYGSGGGKVLFLMCTYRADYDAEEFEANTKEALACVTDGMGDYAKATALHDYLALNIAYDYDNYQANTIPADSYNAYGALVNGVAVCEGYALAYKYLLSEVGIEAYMVKSVQMNHAWNMVKIDGKYYHVDVTWDDPVYDRIGRVRHVYLFRSDDNFDAASSGSKPHHDWVVTSGGSTVNYQATDTTYESTFWTKSNAPLVFDGSDCYYITGSGGVNRADFSDLTGEGTPLVDSIGRWPVWGSATSFYTSVFSGLYMINNHLYYNDTTSIYSISPDESNKRTEFTADTSTGYICGSAYRKGRVYYCLKQNPNEQKKETLLSVELGAANLTQGYQTVTDQTVTAAADGRPKMLVFFKMDDTNSDDALNAIELILDGIASGIDVYAIETEKAGKEALKENYQDYTDITFCYDTAEGNKNSMKAYAEAGGTSAASENYPVICYIDKYDHLRYVSAGENSVGSIQENMRIYCQYPDAAYKITYVLNGGTNHGNNPTVYTAEGVTLQDASREGFTFCGWYRDAAFKKKVTQIPAGSNENLTLYAKWQKRGEGLNLANPAYTFTTIDEKRVSSTADGRPKVLFYFRQGCGMCQSTSLQLKGHIKAFAGVDIYAIDIDEKTKSEVSAFRTSYGCEEITYCYGSGYSTSMHQYIAGAGIQGIATPIIAYISADNRYQGCTQGSRSWSEVLEDLQKFCGHDYYYIKYELDGGKNDSASPEMYQSGRGAALKDPSKFGYEFEGWYKDAAFTQEVTQIPAESSENLTLYAKWQRREEKLDLDNPNRSFATIDGQRINSTANGRPKVLFFFKVGCANCEAASIELREHISVFGDADIYAIETSNVARNQVAAFKEQYGCDEITYSYEEIDHLNRDIMTVYYRTAQYSGTVEPPFIVYISADNRFQWYTMGNRSWSQMLGDLQKYCDYEPPKEGVYRITYELNGGTNDAANPATYTAETETIVLKDAVKEGYVFEGWYRDAAFTEKVEQIAKGSTGGITLYAKWKLKGYGLANLDQTYTALDDTKLSSKADGQPKLLVFYRYSSSDTASMAYNIGRDIGGLGGVDIYAVECEGSDKESIKNLECDGITLTYCTNKSDLNKAGAYLQAAGMPVQTVDGGIVWPIDGDMPVICYIDKDNMLQWVTKGRQTVEQVLENLKQFCDYEPPRDARYKIIYLLNGGTNSADNPATYTVETETITLQDASKPGFKFGGWYKDVQFKEKVEQIVKGSTGNITLYAKWEKEAVAVALPAKTTYKVGEELDITGGKVTVTPTSGTAKTYTMTADMLTGFDSSQAGLCKVTVTKDGYTGSFDVLIVEEPELTAVCGQALLSVTFPANKYGVYSWARSVNTMQRLNKVGVYTFDAQFSPKDKTKFQTIALQARVNVKVSADEEEKIEITFAEKSFVYNGKEQKPEVKVTAKREDGKDILLKEEIDYTLSYKNNKNAGTATVTVKGIGEYTGEVSEDFIIEPAPLVIRAGNLVLLVGDSIPEQYEYEMDGLFGEDELLKEPTLSCEIAGTETEGEYAVIPSGADAGGNYKITYENGVLRVVSERGTCKVVFDAQGHGKAPAAYTGIPSGSTIDSPKEPAAEGYRFGGWYKDSACTLVWDFENDTVQSDLTLYAKWFGVSVNGDDGFAVQEITDLIYNGKAQKPAVSVYDEDTLLKAGRDYTIKYVNNVNANAGGVRKGDTFNETLPYVAITGKGNYKETVKINFNILPASIGDSYTPAAGVTLKVNDHLVKGTKAQNPFGSIKLGKSMKKDTDYTLKLEPMIARDASGKLVFGSLVGAQVPAGYTGEFVLTVTGKGNYTGSISRNVYVADKDHLMKNVKITLGKDLKNIAYTGSAVKLKAAAKQKPADDEFVVTCGKTVLKPNVDYSVSYRSNTGVGKAEVIVTGKGGYVGKKTANFNIKGKVFSNGTITVEGLQDNMPYTGRAVVQNKNAILKWKEGNRKLEYGVDYTVSYSKNINKGTATISFTGKPEAGYSGTVKKTFRIGAADIADTNKVKRAESMNAIRLPYSKAGVKPVEEIVLTDEKGSRLRYGKDYTLTYKNNKAVAGAGSADAPTATVKGKGNYSGSFDVPFTIVQADLAGENITIECAQTAYDSKKPDTYVYQPAIKVREGKMTLKAGTDYEITYEKNTQADCMKYMQNLINNQLAVPPAEGRAVAVITAKEGSAYSLREPIRVPLEIYLEKLTKNSLTVEIDKNAAVYTGGQVRPKVSVTTDDGIPLKEGEDYTLVYGSNTASGKNKGSVTVRGLAPGYGGSVAYKFEIIRKDLKY